MGLRFSTVAAFDPASCEESVGLRFSAVAAFGHSSCKKDVSHDRHGADDPSVAKPTLSDCFTPFSPTFIAAHVYGHPLRSPRSSRVPFVLDVACSL